jgi:dTDP-4-dehydrorhamnose reductase
MRLLITGGSGYLGNRLLHFAAQHADWETHTTYFENLIDHPHAHRLDLRDRTATETLIATTRPDVILHQAVSPRNNDHIAAIIPSARHIMDAAIDHHIRLVHVSTDMVFDGENAPYEDDASPAPLTPYAAAKAFVEGLLMSAMPDEVLIVRPSLMYGFDPIDKQTGWLVDGIREVKPVTLFTDEIRCPLWVDTAARALLELAASKHTGRLNLGGPPLNRWEFGMTMLACLEIDPGPTVVQSTVAESGLTRPRDLTLNTAKAERWLKTPLLSVWEAFEEAGDGVM